MSQSKIIKPFQKEQKRILIAIVSLLLIFVAIVIAAIKYQPEKNKNISPDTKIAISENGKGITITFDDSTQGVLVNDFHTCVKINIKLSAKNKVEVLTWPIKSGKISNKRLITLDMNDKNDVQQYEALIKQLEKSGSQVAEYNEKWVVDKIENVRIFIY